MQLFFNFTCCRPFLWACEMWCEIDEETRASADAHQCKLVVYRKRLGMGAGGWVVAVRETQSYTCCWTATRGGELKLKIEFLTSFIKFQSVSHLVTSSASGGDDQQWILIDARLTSFRWETNTKTRGEEKKKANSSPTQTKALLKLMNELGTVCRVALNHQTINKAQ